MNQSASVSLLIAISLLFVILVLSIVYWYYVKGKRREGEGEEGGGDKYQVEGLVQISHSKNKGNTATSDNSLDMGDIRGLAEIDIPPPL